MIGINEIERAISKIRIVDLNEEDAYSKIEHIIKHDIIQIALPSKNFKSGLKFHRCCNNDDIYNEFQTIDRLSFRCDLENIKDFGRANKPYQSIFYAADIRPTAISETSKIARGKNYGNIDKFSITTSQWESISELNLTLIVNNKIAQERNELINAFNVDLDQLTKDIFKNDSEKVFELLNFLSDEFAINTKDNCNLYKISCAFAQLAYQVSDGIIYPSLQRLLEGVNFAIKPESVKEKLKFISATRDIFAKKGENEFIHIDTKSTIGYDGNRLIWGINKKLPAVST